MTPAATIVWIRRDLRLTDNLALHAAVETGAAVIPVFIWAPEEEAPWQPGAASRWWLHYSLESFDASLRAAGSRLIVRRGPSLDALLEVAKETGAQAIVWNRMYEPVTVARDRLIKAALAERGFTVKSFHGNLLFEPGTILNSKGEPFRVFTAFWKAALKAAGPPHARGALAKAPPRRIIAPMEWPESVEIGRLGLLPKIDWAEGLRATWQPGEAAAQECLRIFDAGRLERYGEERDRPDHAGTSRLSPYLHFGEISPRQIREAVLSQDHPFARQLLWREFAHHLLHYFPDTPEQPMRPEFARFPWRMDEGTFRAWTRGETGYPLVDAGMRELWRTGWMHNRVRMVTASFLVKHLLIPWQAGAAWFWDTLVDADLANNTLGWQWVAGCGADAAPYFRIFNPLAQAKNFDPKGDYVRKWAPETNRAPIVDHVEARARALLALMSLNRR